MSKFEVHIATVTSELFSGEADELHVEGVDGALTVLAHHEPFITQLKEGSVRVLTEEGTRSFAVTRGVLEVANNKATVLCSSHNG